MNDELARHGYRLSPGTLYSLLARLERESYLTSATAREGRTSRSFSMVTRNGREGAGRRADCLNDLSGETDPSYFP